MKWLKIAKDGGESWTVMTLMQVFYFWFFESMFQSPQQCAEHIHLQLESPQIKTNIFREVVHSQRPYSNACIQADIPETNRIYSNQSKLRPDVQMFCSKNKHCCHGISTCHTCKQYVDYLYVYAKFPLFASFRHLQSFVYLYLQFSHL